MTAYPNWTPASRPGIVPLHPYGFGTILGRSFVALRHNPKVLLGFALVVQAVAYIVLAAAVGAIAVASFSRLDTVAYGGDDWGAIFAGSTVITGAAALVLSLLVGALSVVVQGVVVSEVAHAVVAEKPTLKAVWARVRPVIWRLIGYSALVVLASLVVVGVLAGIVTLLVISVLWLGILVGVLFVLGLIPLYAWLTTKLFLVPSAIILEGAGIRAGIARSWRLTRRRFWSTFGVIVIISFGFSVLAQLISVPFSLIAGIIPGILAPTGTDEIGAVVGMVVVQVIGQFGILLVQCIALVVQSTSAALVYVDARMRVEGLDHDLHTYVEARDAGATDLADPYLVGVGRVVERPAPVPVGTAPPYAGYGAQAGYGAPTGYGAPAPYGAPPVPAPAWDAPAAGSVTPADRSADDAVSGPATPPPAAPPSPDVAPPAAPTSWAAPGSPTDR